MEKRRAQQWVGFAIAILMAGFAGFLLFEDAWTQDQEFAPLSALPPVPETPDNPTTQAKVKLGKMLFFDVRLSGDVSTSCASCHSPRFGWGDGQELSRGYPGTQHWRNSQTVVNAAYLKKFFWGGEKTSLESQADSAITGNLAGNADPIMIEERLAQVPEYVRFFKEAFGVERPNYGLALKAIAAFERTIVTQDTPFDRYMKGEPTALSDRAKQGLQLFQGKARCIQCHNGPLLTDESFHHLAVPENPLFTQDPQRQIALRYQHYSRGVAQEIYRKANRDLGLYYTTKRPEDMGKFRTAPLRYISYTTPYMHNGFFYELEEVIDFYNQGGGEDPNKSPLLKPLNLTAGEKKDLLEFLKSLSGLEIRMEAPQLPEYVAMTKANEGN